MYEDKETILHYKGETYQIFAHSNDLRITPILSGV